MAAVVGEPTASRLIKLLRQGAQTLPAVRWVQPEQLHLTFKFIGALDSADLYPVCQRVSAACRQVEPFGLQVDNLGTFPKGKPPRVIWAAAQPEANAAPNDISDNISNNRAGQGTRQAWPAALPSLPARTTSMPATQCLHQLLDSSLAELGFRSEARAFTPHITLGRVTSQVDVTELDAFLKQASQTLATRFEIDELVLLDSQKKRGGMHYEQLEVFELG